MADLAGPLSPASVAVVGAGTMGVGIAYVHAVAGSRVWLVEPGAERRQAVRGILADAAASGLKRGKLSSDQAALVETAVTMVPDGTDLPTGIDLIVETVPELPDLKERVLRQLASREPRILATNTSSISIDRLSACAVDPTRFLGMHYFNPVWSLPMVELVRGAATTDDTVALARAYAESTGKTTIVSQDVPGFATSRLDMLAAIEAIRMLEDGVASAEDIDKGQVVAFRHPVGPLKLCDIVGLDVRLDIALYLSSKLGDRFAPPKLLRDKVERGELGVKSGKGFFDWSDTRYFVSKDAGPRA